MTYIAESIPLTKMPGHWVLARAGKRVLRPGGLGLTRRLLRGMAISDADRVIEFAPGIGATAAHILGTTQARYTGVERNRDAFEQLRSRFGPTGAQFLNASAEATGLDSGCATALIGEAMLTMQSPAQKERIVREAARLLVAGGCYAIHEMCIVPDDLDDQTRRALNRDISLEIHNGVQPISAAEWRTLLEQCGFEVEQEFRAPMHLLEPLRMIADEGILGAARIVGNLLLDSELRRRVLAMRRLFRRYQNQLGAVGFIARRRLE